VDESRVFGQVYVPPGERKGRHGGEFADMMTARVASAPVVVFLGVLESSESSNLLDQPGVQVGEGVKGVPYFALDVAGTGKEQDILGQRPEGDDGEVAWAPARSASARFAREEAAIFGEARSMLDWNTRNKVCLFLSYLSPSLVQVTDRRGRGSSALPVDRGHFPFGEDGSWFADHSYLVRSRSLSLAPLGEFVCLRKRHSLIKAGLQERVAQLYAPPDRPCRYYGRPRRDWG
jgi:NADH pyrophosphatase-like rudimentary NUDIX domain